MATDREELIILLGKLGDDDDAVALAAARAIAQIAERDGLDWEEVVAPLVDPAPAPAPVLDAGADMGEIIAAVVAAPGISEETRQEMDAFAQAWSRGELDPDDRGYITALAARLHVI